MARQSHNRTTTSAPGVKLTAHVKGWVAKIGGKVKWLAPLSQPQLALERYHQKMADYQASLKGAPVTTDNNAALGHLGELFLAAKASAVTAGELKPRTFRDYKDGIQAALDYFGGKVPALSIPSARWQQYKATMGDKDVHTVGRLVGAIRTLSAWANKNEYIDRPFRFGTEFNRPSQKAIRKAKDEAGERVFDAAQVAAIVKVANPAVRALFLLALNGGIGNTDLSEMRKADVDLKKRVADFKRSKTGVGRVVPLWPKTIKAIKEAMPARPAASDPALDDRLFLTPTGKRLVREKLNEAGEMTSWTDSIGVEFGKVARVAGVERAFYDARRTFQTIGDETGFPHVVRFIMGHAGRSDDMSGRYRQGIRRTEMEKVTNHVADRLKISKISWPEPGAANDAKAAQPDQQHAKPSKRQRPKAETAK